MPTTRPRYQVTETPAIAAAIDRAAQRWPGESRAKLLVRLVETGSASLECGHGLAEHHAEAVMASSGKYADAFGPGYLDDLRRDWPV